DLGQSVAHVGSQRVPHLGPVERHPRHGPAPLEQQLVAHGRILAQMTTIEAATLSTMVRLIVVGLCTLTSYVMPRSRHRTRTWPAFMLPDPGAQASTTAPRPCTLVRPMRLPAGQPPKSRGPTGPPRAKRKRWFDGPLPMPRYPDG